VAASSRPPERQNRDLTEGNTLLTNLDGAICDGILSRLLSRLETKWKGRRVRIVLLRVTAWLAKYPRKTAGFIFKTVV
jgi:hypothetical protein